MGVSGGASGGGGSTDTYTGYTPTLTQSGAVAKTVDAGRTRYAGTSGSTVKVQGFLTVTAVGTANNVVTFTLPSGLNVAGTPASGYTIGVARLYDSSAGTVYRGMVVTVDATTCRIEDPFSTGGNGLGVSGARFSAALDVGDVVEWSVQYEAA